MVPPKDEPVSATPEGTPPDESSAAAPNADASPNNVSLASPSVADLLNDKLWVDGKFTPEPVEDADPAAEEDAASETASEQQAIDESASDTEAPETDEQPIDPATVQKLFEENRQLLRLKGKQGSELGAARDRVAELEARLARLEKGDAAPEIADDKYPQSEEEWDNLFTTSPRKALSLWEQQKSEAARIEAERKQAEEAEEIAQVTPQVGAQLFTRAHKIEDFDKWSGSDEGKQVVSVLASNRQAKLALFAAIQTGDAEAISEILGNGLKAVRAQAKAAASTKTATEQVQRANASKPTSIPRPGRVVQPTKVANPYQMTAAEMLQMSDEDWQRAHRR